MTRWRGSERVEPFSWKIDARRRVAARGAARRDRRERRLLRAARGAARRRRADARGHHAHQLVRRARVGQLRARPRRRVRVLWFARCSPAVVLQLNTIYNFRGRGARALVHGALRVRRRATATSTSCSTSPSTSPIAGRARAGVSLRALRRRHGVRRAARALPVVPERSRAGRTVASQRRPCDDAVLADLKRVLEGARRRRGHPRSGASRPLSQLGLRRLHRQASARSGRRGGGGHALPPAVSTSRSAPTTASCGAR